MNSYFEVCDLCGEWQFKKAGAEEKYPVTVPGSVLSGMLSNGLIEDPFKGVNEYKTREMLRDDFTFFRDFEFDGDDSLSWDLVMEGINTLSNVYLNDKLVCNTSDMHVRYVENVNKLLKKGTNTIRVEIKSPITYIESVKPSKGKEITYVNTGSIFGNQYIRQAHSMFGWDWGPQLPDMGIWRGIYLRAYDEEVLEYVQIKQIHEENMVYITVSGDAISRKAKESKLGYMNSDKKYGLKVTVLDPSGKVIVDEVDASEKIAIEKPEYWWPNRLGEHPLYTVKVTLVSLKNGEWKGNTVTEKIGLRTLTVSQDPDEFGKEFCFKVNGVKIFSKGADYIPEDCVYSRITRQTIKHLVDSCVDAGFNTIRVWGGGYYPSDEFYEMCDEAGIIVWQDFMFACNIYDLTKDLAANITEEAICNVRRLRNHAALGLWCGNNECESAWVNWGNFKDHSKALKNDYLKMFETILPDVLKKEDGEHFYWPSSPSAYGSFSEPDCDNVGDRHYWDVWHGEKPFSDYEKYFFRFCSEFGFQSFPEMATIKTFAEEGDFNIFSEVMESHQKNGTANAKILKYISENFLYPKNFENLTYVSQVLQGLAMKHGVEHWRRNRGRCMGTLYWQLNDNWPVASWSSIDYYGRWKALQYMARHFYQDIAGSIKRDEMIFTPYVTNETFKDDVTKVLFFVKTMDNQPVFASMQEIKAKSFSSEKGEAVDITSAVARREDQCYVEVVFEHSDGTVSRQVEPVKRYKHMKLPKANINANFELLDSENVKVTLSSDSFAAFVALVCEDEQIIFSDNYIFMTGQDVTITGKLRKPVEKLPEIKVLNLSDSYES